MAQTSLDIRQSQTRVLQDQLNSAATTQMDSTLASINSELTSPGRLIAAATPSLVITVGSGTITNPNTSKNRVLPFLNNIPITFTGGTITFPSTSGTITVSSGTNGSITIGASQFAAVLIQINSSGQFSLVTGTAVGSLGAVVVPSGSTSLLSLGYVIVQTNGSSVIQNITNAMLYQFVGGGGSGSSGSGTGDDLDALQYQSDVTEAFANSPTAAASQSTVDTTQTNATYSAANAYMTMSYDASKTVTGTGTSMTLSGTPSYTVVAGDILRVGTQARKITVVTTQTSYTIESAFSTNPSAAAATVSQAVYSKDLNNFAFNGVAISAIYTSTISDCLVLYNDTASGTLYNYTDPPLVAFTASGDGSTYTTVQAREANPSSTAGVTSLATTGSNMYLRFFSNASSGTGTVNLVGYKSFFHRLSQTESGGILNQAICFTNAVGTPVGCSNPTLVGGVTQIVLNNSFPVGVNSGFANGSLIVVLNGQKIPRFINSTLTPDASYTEINANTIALDRNYSSQNYSVEIYQFVAVVDSNTQNTTNISAIQTNQLRNSLINGNFDFWQRGTSTTVANAATAYQADRWYVKNSLGTSGVITYSQASPTLNQSKWAAKVQISTAPTAAQANGTELYQTLENEDTLIYLGNSASFSVYVKALGNVTAVGLQFFYATTETKVTTALGSEQSVSVNGSTFTLGQLQGQLIGTTPTTSGSIGVRIRILTVSTGNTYDINNGFVVEQAMMNLGGSCLPTFQRAGINTQQELHMCERYYEKSYNITDAPGSVVSYRGPNLFSASTTLRYSVPYRVFKRTGPVYHAYSTATGTIDTVRDLSSASDVAVTYDTANQGQTSVFGTVTASHDITWQWIADAEI